MHFQLMGLLQTDDDQYASLFLHIDYCMLLYDKRSLKRRRNATRYTLIASGDDYNRKKALILQVFS